MDSLNVPAEKADSLAVEYLFRENGKEHWIPVLNKITAGLDKQFKSGDEITVYYFILGGFNPKRLYDKDTSKDKAFENSKDAIRWIFAIETFDVPKAKGSSFPPQSLDQAVDRNMESPGRILNLWIDPRQVRSKTRFTFTGDTREVSEKRLRLLELWIEHKKLPSGVFTLMQTEARFLDGEKEYWLPIRALILNEIKKNVKKGDKVSLHTILVGGIREADRVDWVFLAGEYSL